MHLFTELKAFSPRNKEEPEGIHVLQFPKSNDQENDSITDDTGLGTRQVFFD
jgi:hypothetical protein